MNYPKVVTLLYAIHFAVIKVALPGINGFLEEVLLEENLSEKGEKIRLDFVNILDNLGSEARTGEIFTASNNDQQSSHHPPETRAERSGDDLQGYIEDNTAHWSEETAVIEEKVFICLFRFFFSKILTN